MTLILYGHPFSSYTWKAMIAFHEKDMDLDFRNIDPAFPENAVRFAELAPFGKFPVLIDGQHIVPEATIIIEHLDHIVASPAMIPADPNAAMEVRLLDRLFDNYVMTPMQAFVEQAMGMAGQPQVDRAKAMLDRSYAWFDAHMVGREWAGGADFTLADCAAAPSLFYADWVHRIPDSLPHLQAYRARVLARSSVSRCVEGARPYRHYFPLGAPDRD
jgi:glutathione S-transferase